MVAIQATYNIDDFQEFYIGGAPQDVRERYMAFPFSLLSSCIVCYKRNLID